MTLLEKETQKLKDKILHLLGLECSLNKAPAFKAIDVEIRNSLSDFACLAMLDKTVGDELYKGMEGLDD